MTGFIAPWSPNFTNDVNNVVKQVETDVTAAVDSVVPGALPTAPAAPVPPAQVPTSSTPVLQNPVVTNVAPPVTGSLSATTALTQAAEAAVKQALPGLEGPLQADLVAYAQSYLAQVLAGNPNPQIPNVTFDGQSLTKTAAKGHAWRTFLIGMSTSAASAVLSAIGDQAHLDFFSKSGWIATATIAVSTLVQTVIAYLGRLQITPDYEKQLLAASPSLALQHK